MPPLLSDTVITIGQLASPYGLKGWLRVNAFTEVKADILSYQPWQFYRHHQWVHAPIQSSRLLGGFPLVLLEDCPTPEAARVHTGIKIGIYPSQLPPLSPDEYYWSQLTGLTVMNREGQALGKVDRLFATGANDVLVVIGEKTHYIPYVLHQFIDRIDLNTQQIIVDWGVDF